MNIEEVTKTRPGDIHTLHVDPFTGLRSYHARGLALKLGLKGVQADAFVKLAGNLWKLFLEKDCSLVEVNPLVVTGAGSLVSMDCKINFDDNALFRHPEYEDMADLAQMDPLEVKARKFDIAYIKLAGNIGCMVNGAGLAMATLDVLRNTGASPPISRCGRKREPGESGRGVPDHPERRQRQRGLRQYLRRDHALRHHRSGDIRCSGARTAVCL